MQYNNSSSTGRGSFTIPTPTSVVPTAPPLYLYELQSSASGFTMPSAPQFNPNSFASNSLPTSTVELSVKCSDLANKDLMSYSDPVCIMFIQKQGQWFELGRTEKIKDTLNPAWEKRFVVDYSFEERQIVKFEIYDWDMDSTNLGDHDFLGRIETSLGSIVSSGHFIAVLKDSTKKNSKIQISAEELKSNKEVAKFQFRAEKLDKKDFFGKSDPFFVISKKSTSGSDSWTVVKKSETIMKTLNPTWTPFEISVRDLSNGDHDRPLKIDVYDWNSNGTHDFIGSITTSLSKLNILFVEKTGIACINEEKKRKKGSSYKNSGMFFVQHCQIETQPTFVEYLQGGVSMNFSVAVDFTASNGDPRGPDSLHYTGNQGENQYTTAIRSVGDIIQDYDTDKQFPALGFGAKIPPHGNVSHEFYLNLRPDTPYCAGVDGLLNAYWNAINNVRLYGPTNFAPVINHVANFARAYQSGDQYFVLLIITDGIITDMEATKYAIVNACDLPMSIIIVGVGNEEFDSMEELDGDNQKLSAGGRVASRDIVQFVELRKFLGQRNTWSKELLAKEVLAEIPQQFVGWMKSRGIYPKNVPTPSPL